MNKPLLWRAFIALALLLVSWLTLEGFERHIHAPGPLPEVPLSRPLVDLPLQIGEWKGTERPITDKRTLYADEHLQRLYVNTQTQQTLLVWIVYSKDGEDRGHHPEVCMAVAGRPEDPSERSTVEAPGHRAPIQQYRFGAPGDRQWVFYWHYTLLPAKSDSLSDLQRFYQRLHRRPSSVTLEVFAPENRSTDGEEARRFALQLDAAIQSHLGATAVRGSNRLPVTVLRGEEPQENLPPRTPAN